MAASYDISLLPQLRLSILVALQGKDNFLASFGVVCSSWISASRGGVGNMRSFVAPMGNSSNAKIQAANLMVARTLAIYSSMTESTWLAWTGSLGP